MAQVTYNFEFERRLRAGFIGCGGHSFRNIYPAFQYLPIELAAVCDVQVERAEHFRRLFGAAHAYGNHRRMIEAEPLDVVFIVTNYDERGRARFAALAADCLRAGAHVWTEKPPVNDLAEVALLREAVAASGRKLAFGFKKIFFPANRRAKSLTADEHFGEVRSISLRYPQYIPTVEELKYDGTQRDRFAMRVGFLDHLCHPVSLLTYLGGPAESLYYVRAEGGSGFATFEMAGGAVASIHFTRGQARSSPLERTEIVGEGANVVVENCSRVTYYRPIADAGFRRYGRSSDFTGEITDAPIVWEPEFSLGQLYNKGIFLLGYYDELKYFCDAVLEDAPVLLGGLDYAEEGIRIYEAFGQGPGEVIPLRGT